MKNRGRGYCQTPWTVGSKRVEYIPFCGTRVGELKFANRVICWVWVKGLVIRVVGIFEIWVREIRVNITGSEKG